MSNTFPKATLHFAYLLGIALKGVDGLLEIGGGAMLLFTSRAGIVHLVESLARPEMAEGPGWLLEHHAVHMARTLSPGTLHFATIYLLIHGCIKVGLVAALMKGWRQAYPVALVLLTAFIVYQCFRLFRDHSLFLATFTAIDIVIVVLIWLEWRRVAWIHGGRRRA